MWALACSPPLTREGNVVSRTSQHVGHIGIQASVGCRECVRKVITTTTRPLGSFERLSRRDL
jgi:hypothetical protein